MRWIFYSLLLCNVVLFAYLLLVGPTQKAPMPVVGPAKEHTQRLILLSERDNQPIETIRLNPTSQQVTTADESAPKPLSRSLCTLVGAFANEAKAGVFVERLAVLGVEAKVKNLLVSKTVGYWLHLPPLSSRKEILLRLRELQRQGVDSYVIPDGELENGISLGMFSEQRRAKALRKKVAKMGYQPDIAKVPREKREVWLFIKQDESVKISPDRWSKLLSGKELLQKQQNLCSDVASA